MVEVRERRGSGRPLNRARLGSDFVTIIYFSFALLSLPYLDFVWKNSRLFTLPLVLSDNNLAVDLLDCVRKLFIPDQDEIKEGSAMNLQQVELPIQVSSHICLSLNKRIIFFTSVRSPLILLIY